jgi:hypothetical protein
MSLAATIEESAWLVEEKPYGKNIIHEWSNVVWVDSFSITNFMRE